MYSLTPLEYLDSLLIDYTLIPHSTSFTAQETAETAHIKGKNLCKVVVIGAGQFMAMLAIPANCVIRQSKISNMLMMRNLDIVSEAQFSERFPECEIGAMPPFGRLYGMDVYLAKELAEQETIIFNAGNHNLLVKMRTSDFISLSDPRIIYSGYTSSPISQITSKMANRGWHWRK